MSATQLSPLYRNDFGCFSLEKVESRNQIIVRWGNAPESINPGVVVQVGRDYDLNYWYGQLIKKIELNDQKFVTTLKDKSKMSLKRGNYPVVSAGAFFAKKKPFVRVHV